MSKRMSHQDIADAISFYPGQWFLLHHSKSWHAAVSHASMLRHGDSKALSPEEYGFKAEMWNGMPAVLVQRLDW